MSSKLRTRKKSPRTETSDFSAAPAQGLFQSRPFGERSPTAEKSQQPDLKTALMRAERYDHSLLKMQLNKSASTQALQVQAKLSVGAPGDTYEQEADAVAAQVVDKINEEGERSPTQQLAQSQSIQQRKQQKYFQPLGLNIQPLMQRESAGGVQNAKPHLEQSIEQKRGGGQPLANNIRRPMERSFGSGFSGVKVHTDAQSDQLNQSIQAKAFTTGQDIFFRQGAYDPGSRKGQELIAHELTHVVQQSGGAVQRTHSPQTGEASTQKERLNFPYTAEMPPVQLWPDRTTRHLMDQANTRGITEQETENAVSGGTKYDDPDYPGGTVYYDSSTGVVVCAVANGNKTTCYRRARPKSRWTAR